MIDDDDDRKLEVPVTRPMLLTPLKVPTMIDAEMAGDGKKALYTKDVDEATLDKLAEDWLRRFYEHSGKRNPWTRRSYR